jgi:PAS domain S-box-containing protein
MTDAPTFDVIFAVMSAASEGNTQARISIPDTPEDDLPTRLAVAVNRLLDELNFRANEVESAHKVTQAELERLVFERTEQLRQSEEKFSKAFRASPAAISIAALPEGRWLEFNDALVKLTGYSREELVGHTSSELGLVDTTARAAILEAIRVHGAVRDVEIKLHGKTKEIDVLVSTEQIELDGQKCALTIQYDITELKRAEREVRRLNEDLQRRQAALEAANHELEAFSYSVSHDLRAPLRSLIGYSHLLSDDYQHCLDEQGQRFLQRIQAGGENMSHLIDALLHLAHVSRAELHVEPVNLSALARRTQTELQEQNSGREVACVIENDLVVQGDQDLLSIVITNLLNNAWKFTRKQAQARIEFGVTTHEAQSAFFVRDNGAGFDMAYAEKLFGTFQRLHRASDYEGTGIGLATVERIIHRHGGRIWAEAAVNEGATFYFTLNGSLTETI